MDYVEELENDKGYQRLDRARDWYRTNILFNWPEWMPGTLVLAWRLDKKMYLMQQVIENRIYSRRVAEYKRDKYERFMMSNRFDRELPPMEYYAPGEVPAGLGIPAR